MLPKGDDWCNKVLWALPLGTRGDSEKAFEVRLRLARMGHADGLVDWSSLAKEFPRRAIQLIEAVLSTCHPPGTEDNISAPEPTRKPHSRLEHWLPDDVKTLLEVASEHSSYAWDMLTPHVMRLAPTSLDESRYLWLDWEETEFPMMGSPTRDLLIGVIQMVRAAGRALAGQQPDELMQRSRPF